MHTFLNTVRRFKRERSKRTVNRSALLFFFNVLHVLAEPAGLYMPNGSISRGRWHYDDGGGRSDLPVLVYLRPYQYVAGCIVHAPIPSIPTFRQVSRNRRDSDDEIPIL